MVIFTVGQRITKTLREGVFSSIIAQEIAFFDETRTGELINRLASDVELVSGAVTQNVSDGLRSVAQATAGIGMMVLCLFFDNIFDMLKKFSSDNHCKSC